MRIIGVDAGSTFTKIAVWENSRVEFHIFKTLRFMQKGEGRHLLSGSDYTVSTGYGRHRVESDESMPEIRAHYLGAIEQTGLSDFTLLDIGGQDFKIIPVHDRVMGDFIMNDKCAAGTGRFLEKMAQILDISLDELSNYWENPVPISAVCAVFAETEVIGQMIDGHSIESIAAGVNWSLYHRLRPYLLRLKSRTIVLSGGGTSGRAIRMILRKEGFNPVDMRYSIYNGALGCLILALKRTHNYREGFLSSVDVVLPKPATA